MPAIPQGRSFLEAPDWLYCDFDCYANWLTRYIQASSTIVIDCKFVIVKLLEHTQGLRV